MALSGSHKTRMMSGGYPGRRLGSFANKMIAAVAEVVRGSPQAIVKVMPEDARVKVLH